MQHFEVEQEMCVHRCLRRGENSVKVLRDLKGAENSGFPLFKGDGRGISRARKHALAPQEQNLTPI